MLELMLMSSHLPGRFSVDGVGVEALAVSAFIPVYMADYCRIAIPISFCPGWWGWEKVS